MGDIFDVYDDVHVSQKVVAIISATLHGPYCLGASHQRNPLRLMDNPARTKRAAKHKTENLSAWDDYIKVLSTFYADVASFKTVEELCHRAFALDEHFTGPYFVCIKALLKLQFSP